MNNQTRHLNLFPAVCVSLLTLVLVEAISGFEQVAGAPAKTPPQSAAYDKWIWAQLRAFDSSAPGFGAAKYVANLHFKPDGVLLFLVNPDFLFEHPDPSSDAPLSSRYSYFFDPQAQPWTRIKLRGLIDGLHQQGVKAYLSLMGFTDGTRSPENAQVRSLTRSGHPQPSVNPLRRLASGAWYEDLFVAQLEKVLLAYGFDGFHAADGLTHLGQPLACSDYSDDMVRQFQAVARIDFPPELAGNCEGKPDLFKQRVAWIWQNQRLAWIQFYRQRWPVFWRKILATCHRHRKGLIMNQPLTKDPYEALYRYGFDYRAVADLGIDALVVETVAGPAQLGGYTPGAEGPGVTEDTELWLDDALSMILTVKAYAPALRLLFLGCVQDENELWDTLRLAPAFLEKELFSYPATFFWDPQGAARRCLDGVLFCLGDRLSAEEWQRALVPVDRSFSIVSAPQPKPSGITVVWSDAALERQLQETCRQGQKPILPLHGWLKLLSHEGASIRAIVRSENLEGALGPLLVVDPELMSNTEHTRIQAWLGAGPAHRILVALGENLEPFTRPIIRVEENPAINRRQCALVTRSDRESNRVKQAVQEKLALPETNSEGDSLRLITRTSAPFFSTTTNEPISFLDRLPYQPVSREFVSNCAAVVAAAAEATVTASAGKGFVVEKDTETAYLLLENRKPRYGRATIRAQQAIKRILPQSRFPNRVMMSPSRQASLVMPPDGIAVLEIQFGAGGQEQGPAGADHWLAENYVSFPVTLVVTFRARVAPTQLELVQSDWYSGDYRAGDFAVDLPLTAEQWQEVARGRLPDTGGATAKVTLPGTPITSLRIRILGTHDTEGAISCGLRRVRLWAGEREIPLTGAKVRASSTFPGYDAQNVLRDPKAP